MHDLLGMLSKNMVQLCDRWHSVIGCLSSGKVLKRTWEADDEAIQEEVNNSIWHSESAAFVLLIPLEEMAISLMSG